MQNAADDDHVAIRPARLIIRFPVAHVEWSASKPTASKLSKVLHGTLVRLVHTIVSSIPSLTDKSLQPVHTFAQEKDPTQSSSTGRTQDASPTPLPRLPGATFRCSGRYSIRDMETHRHRPLEDCLRQNHPDLARQVQGQTLRAAFPFQI